MDSNERIFYKMGLDNLAIVVAGCGNTLFLKLLNISLDSEFQMDLETKLIL